MTIYSDIYSYKICFSISNIFYQIVSLGVSKIVIGNNVQGSHAPTSQFSK